MSELVFTVDNMKCGGCVDAVTKAINAMPGAEAIEVSLDDKKAVVSSDQPAAEIAQVITDAGYPAEPV